MGNIFFVSDTHFGHANILTFLDGEGKHFRNFSSVEEMDETMVQRWNEVVRPGDKVYHLGDVGFRREVIESVMPRLNGQKRLLVGNHDDVQYLSKGGWFKKVMLWRFFTEHGFLCSHVPLHESAMFKVEFNVHGHIHDKPAPTPRHINICVEQTDYRPIHMDELIQRMRG